MTWTLIHGLAVTQSLIPPRRRQTSGPFLTNAYNLPRAGAALDLIPRVTLNGKAFPKPPPYWLILALAVLSRVRVPLEHKVRERSLMPTGSLILHPRVESHSPPNAEWYNHKSTERPRPIIPLNVSYRNNRYLRACHTKSTNCRQCALLPIVSNTKTIAAINSIGYPSPSRKVLQAGF